MQPAPKESATLPAFGVDEPRAERGMPQPASEPARSTLSAEQYSVVATVAGFALGFLLVQLILGQPLLATVLGLVGGFAGYAVSRRQPRVTFKQTLHDAWTAVVGPAFARTKEILTSRRPAVTLSASGRDITIQQRHASWVGLGLAAIVLALVIAPSAAPASPADQVGRFLGSLGKGDLVTAATYLDPGRVDPKDRQAMYELVLGSIPGTLPDRFALSVRMTGSPEQRIDGEVATVSFTGATSVDYDGSILAPTVTADFHLRRIDGRWLITDSIVR